MTPKQRELARHALGLPNSQNRSYRNRYFTSATSVEWMAMHMAGDAEYATINVFDGNGRAEWRLTRKGAEAALDPGESLDNEDFPS